MHRTCSIWTMDCPLFIKLICGYSAPYGMGHLSKTELNLMHFYTNPKFLLALWKDLADLNLEKLKFWKKLPFGEVMWERNIWNGQMYVNMTSSKGVRTCHHMRRFLRRSLILKVHPNTGQTPGTAAEGEKTNIAKSEGRAQP